MILYIYSVFDKKAGIYRNPVTFKTTAESVRAFGQLCADPTTELSIYAEDYQLELVGEFNTITGDITAESDDAAIKYPIVVTTALTAKKEFFDRYESAMTSLEEEEIEQ
jgi:hypothetical protein